jgi:monofunctional biosynthetic peptidoglycan transglycosylase
MARHRFSWRELPVVQWLARGATLLRWTIRVALILLIVDLFYLAVIWPDWKKLAGGPVPMSSFMQEYTRERNGQKDWPALRWQPVALKDIPKTVQRAVILAEDSRFYTHSGFDLMAFKEAMGRNIEEGRLAFGASTISQQTVKNIYLTRSRDPLRKWHELILTWGMEQNMSKQRILELYLNVAEFGHGVYGVQAAARHYWNKDIGQLTPVQAAELAATLPSPRKHNPATRTEAFDKRAQRVMRWLQRHPGDAADLLPPASPAGPTANNNSPPPPPPRSRWGDWF